MQAHKRSHRVAGEREHQRAIIMPAKPKRFAGALLHLMEQLFYLQIF